MPPPLAASILPGTHLIAQRMATDERQALAVEAMLCCIPQTLFERVVAYQDDVNKHPALGADRVEARQGCERASGRQVGWQAGSGWGKGRRAGDAQRTSAQEMAKSSLVTAEGLVDRETLARFRHRLQLMQKRQVLARILPEKNNRPLW